ncbi:MAG: DUF86 domain-containing protein [Chloroflexi bacterium]|nr:DUF86 domain-containing protein [Chloroflexota bacterium]
MIKPDTLVALLQSLHERVEQLRRLQAFTMKELTDDFVKWNAALHLLQVSVEIVTDVSAHMLAGNNRVVPDDHRQVIRSMGFNWLLPLEFAESIAPMAGFRNIVVHNYLTVDPQKVGNILYDHLDDFDTFSSHIYDYLRREGHLPSEQEPHE